MSRFEPNLERYFDALSDEQKEAKVGQAIPKAGWIRKLYERYNSSLGIQKLPTDSTFLFLGPGTGEELVVAGERRLWQDKRLVTVDWKPGSRLRYICRTRNIPLIADSYLNPDGIFGHISQLDRPSPRVVTARNAQIVDYVFTGKPNFGLPTGSAIEERTDGIVLYTNRSLAGALAEYASRVVRREGGGAFLYTVATVFERDILVESLNQVGIIPIITQASRSADFAPPPDLWKEDRVSGASIVPDQFHLVGNSIRPINSAHVPSGLAEV